MNSKLTFLISPFVNIPSRPITVLESFRRRHARTYAVRRPTRPAPETRPRALCKLDRSPPQTGTVGCSLASFPKRPPYPKAAARDLYRSLPVCSCRPCSRYSTLCAAQGRAQSKVGFSYQVPSTTDDRPSTTDHHDRPPIFRSVLPTTLTHRSSTTSPPHHLTTSPPPQLITPPPHHLTTSTNSPPHYSTTPASLSLSLCLLYL